MERADLPPRMPTRITVTAEVPQREEAAGVCHGRQLTFPNNENLRMPPLPRKTSKNLRGRELGPSPMRPGP